jgi:hypothetical protein
VAPRAQAVLAFALVALLALTIGAYRFHHDRGLWEADGVIYLRMALQDRGMTPDAARTEANAFIRTTSQGRDPASAAFYTDTPPRYYADQFALFRNRPLFPWLAASLYPRFGPDALKVVSVAGYVAAVILMYLLLLEFVSAWLAVVGALAFALSPWVLNLAAMPLTDDLALALWVAALGALFAYLRSAAAPWLAVLIATTALLTFVRPAAYLPLGAALGALVASPRGSLQRAAATRAAVGIALVGVLFIAYSAWIHGPGITEQLRWQYAWQQAVHGPFASHGFFAWWALSFGSTLALELVVEAYRHNSLFAIVLAVLGFAIARRTIVAPVALGGAVATLVALVANPTEWNRTVTLPLTPIVVLLATLALARLVSRPEPVSAA